MAKIARLLMFMAALFIFAAPSGISIGQAQQAGTTAASATDELAVWNKVKDGGDAGALKSYLEQFPNGMFYDIALSKFKALGGNTADLGPQKSIGQNAKITPIVMKHKPVAKTAQYRKHVSRPILMKHHRIHKVTHKIKLHKRAHKLPRAASSTSNLGNGGHSSLGGGGGGGKTGGWGH